MGRGVTYATGRRQLAFASNFGFRTRGRRLRAQFLRASLRRVLQDAQRGVELRCTYGLTAVREERERMKAWFGRKMAERLASFRRTGALPGQR